MAGRLWTEEEDNIIRENYENISCREIADLLDRTVSSVQKRYNILKLIRKKPEVGDEFNRLTIIEIYQKSTTQGNKTFCKCRCVCGKITNPTLSHVSTGSIKSCGCIREHEEHHNMSNTRLYRIWAAMIARCKYINNDSYKNYAKKGITVCDEWKNSFIAFYNWAMANGYKENLTIDRIDNNGNYCPENCRWASYKTQMNNKRGNKIIIAWNESKTASEWSEDKRCNCEYGQIAYRIKNGWSPEEAISTHTLKNTMHLGKNQKQL